MAGPSRISPRAAALRTFVLAIMLGAVTSASAAPDVTPDQAAEIETRIREAMAGLLGPLAVIPNRPVQIIPAGDHYDLLVPMAAEALDGSGKAQITAVARPLAGGTWTVEDIKISSPLRFTSLMPIPTQGGPRPAQAPIVYTLNVQGQDGRISWDPGFATASTWMTAASAATIHAEGAMVSQESKFGPSRSTITLQPAAPDRADLLLNGTLRDYESDSLVNDAPVHVGMQQIEVRSTLNGMSRTRALTLVQLLTSTMATLLPPAAGQQTGSPPKRAEVTRAILASLQDFASDYALDETVNGFTMRIQDQTIGLERIKLGLAAKSEGGMLQAGMELGIDGLALPDLPLGALGAFIPHRVAFHPAVSGLGIAELGRLIQAAADGRDPNARDVAALFRHGGVRAALESLTVELAGAVFHAEAKMLATGPTIDSVSGTAQITAENFDQLVQKVSTTPEAAQILPVLVLVKGAGKSKGERYIWDLSYKNGKFLVNDVDLTAMSGAPASANPAPRPIGKSAASPGGGAEGPSKSGTPRPVTPKQVPSWGK